MLGHGPDSFVAGGGVVAAPAAAAVSVHRTGRDEVLVDGVVQHHRKHRHDPRHGRGRIALAQRLDPGSDRECGDLTERRVLPVREDVVAQVGTVVLLGSASPRPASPPTERPTQRRLSWRRRDRATGHADDQTRDRRVVARRPSRAEPRYRAVATRGPGVTDPPGACPGLLDPRHDNLPVAQSRR
jgi:hypothetical protein